MRKNATEYILFRSKIGFKYYFNKKIFNDLISLLNIYLEYIFTAGNI